MTTPLAHARYETPFGDLHVFADDDGVVRASGFRDEASIAAHLPVALSGGRWLDSELPHVSLAVSAWLAGDGDAITAVPVKQEGGPFFQDVWHALRGVRAGEPLTYKDLAELAGRPHAMRAVGTACARNAVAPFVPCHRVVSSGYVVGVYGYGGAAIKAAMLTLEAGGSPSDVAGALAAATERLPAPARVAADVSGHRPSA